jgi:hypothetical protein
MINRVEKENFCFLLFEQCTTFHCPWKLFIAKKRFHGSTLGWGFHNKSGSQGVKVRPDPFWIILWPSSSVWILAISGDELFLMSFSCLFASLWLIFGSCRYPEHLFCWWFLAFVSALLINLKYRMSCSSVSITSSSTPLESVQRLSLRISHDEGIVSNFPIIFANKTQISALIQLVMKGQIRFHSLIACLHFDFDKSFPHLHTIWMISQQPQLQKML